MNNTHTPTAAQGDIIRQDDWRQLFGRLSSALKANGHITNSGDLPEAWNEYAFNLMENAESAAEVEDAIQELLSGGAPREFNPELIERALL